MKQDLKTLFETNRHTLLDMELRNNTLLNLIPNQHTLDVTDEVPNEVFQTLVEHNRAMTFIPFSGERENEYKHVISLHRLNTGNHGSFCKGQHDLILKTALSKKELDSLLLKINTNAINHLQEQGGDVLYLATGFLTWFEDINSFKPRHAPLILIPVELFRCEAGDNYQVRYTGAELGTNYTLLTKLQNEFGLTLPLFEDIKNSDEENPLEAYFSQIKQAVFKKARWCIDVNKIVLGFFPYNKFYMYQDLDKVRWPDNKPPEQSALLQKLFDKGFDEDRYLLDNTAINANKTEFLHLVRDADLSQTQAVLSSRTGASFIIQGAPGSGKTQTITNIISQGLADNKKILLVAQKIAALEAVHQGLQDTHLGSVVLPLYAQYLDNKSVIRSLESAFLQDIPELNAERRHEDIERLVYLRDKLNFYCELINSPIGNTQINYHQALGYLSQYEDMLVANKINPERFSPDTLDLSIWDQAHYQQALGKIEEIVEYLLKHGNPCYNIYASTQKASLSSDELEQISSTISSIISLYQKQLEQIHTLSQQMELSVDFVTVADLERVTMSLSYLDSKPDLAGIKTDSVIWANHGDKILSLAQEAKHLHNAINRLKNIFTQEAFQYNWEDIRRTLETKGHKYWRFMSSEYRKAKNTLFSLSMNGLEGGAKNWLLLIDELVDIRRLQMEFEVKAHLLKDTLGIHYQNSSTQWESLIPTLTWLYDIRKKLAEGTLEKGVEFYLIAQHKDIIEEEALIDLNQTCTLLEQTINQLCQALNLDVDEFNRQFYTLSINKITKLSSDLDEIDSLTYLTHLKNELKTLECHHWGQIATTWQEEPQLLKNAFQYWYNLSLATDFYKKTSEINQFDKNEHEGILKQFKESDKQLFVYAQMDILQKIHARMQASPHEEQLAVLFDEVNKKRNHLGVKALLSTAPSGIQDIKPVFIMTPTSVATYLEPGLFEFDMVIFDETSRLCVADTLSPLMRAKQAVVVGDLNQLLPSAQNRCQLEDELEPINAIAPESILTAFINNNAPICYLDNHYRSQHQSLFSVSNEVFYANQVVVLPLSAMSCQAKGIQHFCQPETNYEANETKRFLEEAKSIATAIIKHAKETPHITLGVITLSISQRDSILSELDKLRKKNPECESFFYEQNVNKDFFVKQVDFVQGDVRDTIFISMPYRKSEEGKVISDINLLQGYQGEKRLNVLLTRAKQNLFIFCNITQDELDALEKETQANEILKKVLKSANTPLMDDKAYLKLEQAPLVEAICRSIHTLGYLAEPQVAGSGFYINIKTQDLASEPNLLLTIRCDSVTAEFDAAVMSRDHIKQSMLGAMGWRFYHSWSTDWFRNRHNEMQRIEKAINYSLNQRHQDETKAQLLNQLQLNEEMILANINPVNNYKACLLNELSLKEGDDLASISTPTLSNEISKIIDVESPLHIGQLSLRLMTSTGITKTNKKINAAILDAISQLVKKGKVKVDGEFLLLPEKNLIVRSRLTLPVQEKRFDFIYSDEIKEIIIFILREAVHIHRTRLIILTAYALGFTACSKATKLRIQAILQQLEEAEAIQAKGDIFSL